MFVGMKSQVVATAGLYHSLIVNRKGEMYITSGPYHSNLTYSI